MDFLIKLRSFYKNKLDSNQNYNNSKSNLNGNYVFDKNTNEIQNFPDNISIETVTSFKDFKNFYNFPFQLYKDDPFWVPPLWKEFKVFFKKKILFGDIQNVNYLSLRRIMKLLVGSQQ